MSDNTKGIQWLVFACLFVLGYAIAGSGMFTQLHEEGHMSQARSEKLENEQIAPNKVRVSGNTTEKGWVRVYMAGYAQVVLTTGFLLLVGFVIACMSPVWAWLGIFAGAFHHAWFAVIGSSDFARLSMPDLSSWWIGCFVCLSVFWAALVIRNKFRS